MSRPVLVMIDYENVRHTPSHAFGIEKVDFSPVLLSELLVTRRNISSFVLQVRVYRGMADPNIDPSRARRDMLRVNRWLTDRRVIAVTRPLQYVWRNGAQTRFEKGIDVSLAVDLIRHAHSEIDADVIIASRDSDLNPALEAFVEADGLGRRIEVVSATSLERLRLWNSNRPWCHYLSREDFEAIRDDA